MSYDFDPENLNGDFIDEIYEECLTDEKHVHNPVEVLRPNIVEKRSGIVYIDQGALADYSEYIDYMFGQMRSFHHPDQPFMAFQEGFINYLNAYWSKDFDTLLKLYALGIANGTIYPFTSSKNGVIITKKDPLVIPTLNTMDPKYPEWFEKVYKKEYKPRFKSGREPQDDK